MRNIMIYIFFSLFLLLVTVGSCADGPSTANTRVQAMALKALLDQYPQNLSISWLNKTSAFLSEEDNSFNFIYPVCMQQLECLSGASSFSVESVGLFNSLNLIKSAVKECTNANNPYNCVQQKAGAILVGMVNGDVGQLTYELNAYLSKD